MRASPSKLEAAAKLCEERHNVPAWIALWMSGGERSSAEWVLMVRCYGLIWEKESADIAAAMLRCAAGVAAATVEATHHVG